MRPTLQRKPQAKILLKSRILISSKSLRMKDKVHASLGAFHDWVGYDTELGKHISLAYLEVEAAEF